MRGVTGCWGSGMNTSEAGEAGCSEGLAAGGGPQEGPRGGRGPDLGLPSGLGEAGQRGPVWQGSGLPIWDLGNLGPFATDIPGPQGSQLSPPAQLSLSTDRGQIVHSPIRQIQRPFDLLRKWRPGEGMTGFGERGGSGAGRGTGHRAPLGSSGRRSCRSREGF